jgi:hypothetical protein
LGDRAYALGPEHKALSSNLSTTKKKKRKEGRKKIIDKTKAQHFYSIDVAIIIFIILTIRLISRHFWIIH